MTNIRPRLLLVLAATLACGAFTACDDDYHHHPRHTYRTYDRGDRRDYDRGDDYRYRRSEYRGSSYRSGYSGRDPYYDRGSSVTVARGPVRGPSVTVTRY